MSHFHRLQALSNQRDLETPGKTISIAVVLLKYGKAVSGK
jgi:hypothetical protein